MNIVLLKKEHMTAQFDCGVPALNVFLAKHALQSQASNMTRTYVLSNDQSIVLGYYSLVYGAMSHLQVPKRIHQGTGKYMIPLGIIARLAIDKNFQGEGFGKALLKHAMSRYSQASTIAGLRSVMVTAKDEKAKNFYERYNFTSSSPDESDLFLLMKDVQKIYSQQQHILPEPIAISA